MNPSSRLPFFGLIRVSGDDRAAFLHNQLSNDIAQLPAGSACYATYNTPKGRVLANMLVLNRGDDLLLVLAADLCAAVAKRLQLYVLRSRVTLTILSDWAVAGSPPPQAQPAPPVTPPLRLATEQQGDIWHIHLPHGGQLLVGPAAGLPAQDAASETAWQRHEIDSGYPWISQATSESCVAQMLNQHLLGGVHFKKGCYPGQEVIARAQYRGQVKRGLVAVCADVPLPPGGKLLTQEGEEAGIIINSVADGAHCRALAVIKFAAADTALHLADGGAPLTLQHRFFPTPAAA